MAPAHPSPYAVAHLGREMGDTVPDDQQDPRPPYPVGPPAYGSYPEAGQTAYYPAPQAVLRVPDGLAVATITLSVVLTLVQLASWATSWGASDDLVRMAGSGTDVLAGPVLTYDLVNMLFLPVALAAYVVGCLWLHRSRANVAMSAPEWPHARSPVWVWLGWWVPIVSFWFPYQVVRDVRAGAVRDGSSGLLGLWWTGWLVFMLTWQAGSTLIPVSGVPDASQVRALPWVETVATAAALVALVLWVRAVRQTTDGQARVAPGP